MPIDTSLWSSVVIQGTYPETRFFNFTSYNQTGSLIGAIADSQIAPDHGSTNPFAAPTANRPHTYTITLDAGGPGSANVLDVGGSRLAFIVYRVIAPDQGMDKTGGVGVPAVRFVARNGNALRPQPCPFATAESSLGNMITILFASGFSDAAAFLQKHPLNRRPASLHHGRLRARSTGRTGCGHLRTGSRNKLFPRPRDHLSSNSECVFSTSEGAHSQGQGLRFPQYVCGRVDL